MAGKMRPCRMEDEGALTGPQSGEELFKSLTEHPAFRGLIDHAARRATQETAVSEGPGADWVDIAALEIAKGFLSDPSIVDNN